MNKLWICLISFLLLCGCSEKEIEFEESFKLNIAVHDQNYADRFEMLWNETYPEYEGFIKIDVINEQTMNRIITTDTEIPYDLYWIKDEFVPWVIEDCLAFPEGFIDSFEVKDFDAYSSTINAVKEVYSGLTANGLFYAIDVNQIKDKELNLEDFNSFETMSDIENSFYYLNHELYNLPLLSSDVSYFPGKDKDRIDFESEAFQISKENFQKIITMLELESDASSFDNWFIEQDYISGLIGEWMQVEENEVINGIVYQYRKLPMIGEYQLKTSASSKGVVINENTLYPHAALKCLELMHSIEGIQLLCHGDMDDYPLIPEEMMDQFTFSNIHIKEKAIALNASFQKNLVGIEHKEEISALDYLEDEEVIDRIIECVDEVCITQLQEDYESWINE